MRFCRCVKLRANANISGYALTVMENGRYTAKKIYGKSACFCFYTEKPYILVVASPLQGAYANKIYFKLDVRRQSVFNLYLNFTKPRLTPSRVYTFYLTDKNYGLKLNGNLYFNLK